MLFEPGLPGLPCGKAVAVEKRAEARLLEARAQASPPRPSPPANS